MSSLSRTRIVVAFAVVILAGTVEPARAQLANWSSIAATQPQTVTPEQSLLVVTQGNTVKVFSAITKSWSSITTLFGPPVVTLINEQLVVRDGPTMFWGYSAWTGTFSAQLAFSPGAMLLPTSSPQTWHQIVADGNLLHVFYGFTGQWMTYAFPAPPSVTMGRFCFLVSDGTALYGVSSFYGTLVPAPAVGAMALGAWGNVAVATSASMLHGFSASKGTWATITVAGPPVVTNGNAQPAFVAINDGAMISMFSGHTGTFTTLPVPATATLHLDRHVAVAVDGAIAHAYSALLGTFATTTFAAPPTVIKQQSFALLDDGTSYTAYSATKGAFATPMGYSGLVLQHRAQIAMVGTTPTGTPAAVYSSQNNAWYPGPGVPGTLYLTAVSAIVEETGGGFWGWSQRGDSWIHQAAPPAEVAVAGTSPPNLAETFFARSGATIYTFNPRTRAWRTATTASPATLVRAHHQAILAQDGGTLYGFNLWDDGWSAQTLLAPYSSGGGQVQSAWATDGVRVYAYAGVGQLAAITEFPDFYRASTLGSLFRISISGETGAAAILGAAAAGASIMAPPHGTLLLDPASLVIVLQASIPPSGVLNLTFQIPPDPALSGFEPHFQAGVVGPSGLYLTNDVFPTIL